MKIIFIINSAFPNYSGGISDGEYYNLTAKDGWYVENIHTDLESGGLN